MALLLFIMAAFEAARVRSPATLVAHLFMLHVLTDVRSSRALRLWSAAKFLRPPAAGGGGTQLSGALDHPMQRESSGSAQEQWIWPRACCPWPPLAAAVVDDADVALSALLVAAHGHRSRPAARGDRLQCLGRW